MPVSRLGPRGALRAGFITGLPRFARNDGDAGLVLERVPLNSGLCVVRSSVRSELGRRMNGSRGDSADLWFGFMVRRCAPGLRLGCRASLATTGNEVSCLNECLILDCVSCTASFVLSLSKDERKWRR